MFATALPHRLWRGVATSAAALMTMGVHSAVYAEESPFSPKEFRSFKLLRTAKVTHDTSLFRFALPDPKASINMPVASCVVLQSDRLKDEDGKHIVRPYTPISTNRDLGYVDFLVKRYENGHMSRHVHELQPGDEINIKGPFKKVAYEPNTLNRIGMIAGGSGITPMLQVIQEILDNPEDKTFVTLVFANKSWEDIPMKEEIDHLAMTHSNFEVWYVVDEKPDFFADKSGLELVSYRVFDGHVDQYIVEMVMPPPSSSNSMIYVCGPPGMMKAICGDKKSPSDQGELQGLLKKMKYSPDMVYKF